MSTHILGCNRNEIERAAREKSVSTPSYRILNGETHAFSCLLLPIVNPFRTTFGREAKIFATIPDSVCRCSKCFVDESRCLEVNHFHRSPDVFLPRNSAIFLAYKGRKLFHLREKFWDVILNETIIHGGTKIILDRLFGHSLDSIRERFTARYNSLFLRRNGRCYL